MKTLLLLGGLLAALAPAHSQHDPETVRVPAYAAYIEPDPEGARVAEVDGVTGWTNMKEKIVWYGELKRAGRLNLALTLRLPEGARSVLRLRTGKRVLVAEAIGGRESVTVDFGAADIPAPGAVRLALEGISKTGQSFGDIETLTLSGPAAVNAHFNLKERRNAASVHLGYPFSPETKAVWFYNELTVRTDPIWSYYMACGFQRGYFGIQVNSPTERRIIFSVWDSGKEAVDRGKVGAEDRVQLLAKGEGVVAEDFGNEGTGGHSHLVYAWKAGQTYRFLVSAEPDGTHTTYSGYFYFPERKQWGLIARFRAPKDGNTLRGLYSFNENFGGANGQKRRLAEFGNGWIKTAEGKWLELTTARFTHDPTGRADRKDYGAGVTGGRFFLSNGGFVALPIQYGDTFTRPASGKPPMDIVLPL